MQRLAGDRDLAATVTNVPHPYKDGMAEEWISSHDAEFQTGSAVVLAIVITSCEELVGAIGLHVNKKNLWAELGYWIGKPYWNKGYCTEAARAIVRYGFDQLHVNRIQARHMTKNPASGRVMAKVGMTCEGVLREQVRRWDSFEDMAMYGILASTFWR